MKPRIAFKEIPQGLMGSMMETEAYLSKTGLDEGLLELIRLRVSYINGCAYCIDMHYKEALKHGEELSRLYSVTEWKDAPLYTDQERVSLAWAEYVTSPSGFSREQELFDRLKDYFDKAEIANLTLAVVQINAWNRLMKSFGIEAERN